MPLNYAIEFEFIKRFWGSTEIMNRVVSLPLSSIHFICFKSIVWRNFFFSLGCKIKALRAKTNTYIKTPVRGEEPVFVVTGRKEDVAKAKREILSAAEHFSLIRASRKPSLLGGLIGKSTPPGPPTNVPGQITILVRVPYRVGKFHKFNSGKNVFCCLFILSQYCSGPCGWTKGQHNQAHPTADSDVHSDTITRQGASFRSHRHARQCAVCSPTNRSPHRTPHRQFAGTAGRHEHVRITRLSVVPTSVISLQKWSQLIARTFRVERPRRSIRTSSSNHLFNRQLYLLIKFIYIV